MTPLLVLTNCPDADCAKSISMALLEERLAACVNILAPCLSIYRWQGAIETAEEVTILIKTCTERYPELQAAIAARHPYSVPEIISLPICDGLPAYLDWLSAEIGTANSDH